MSILSHTAVAFSMSADAFAASISKGVTIRKPKIGEALYIGMVFGVVETITPVLGWLIGLAAGSFITSVDHWVAFSILGLIGGKMLYESFQPQEEERPARSPRLSLLILTAIGTSIDAMAVGATFAFLNTNIWLAAGLIGLATFLMATLGIMTGHYIGMKAGRMAERLGGICLMGIGLQILCSHLGLI